MISIFIIIYLSLFFGKGKKNNPGLFFLDFKQFIADHIASDKLVVYLWKHESYTAVDRWRHARGLTPDIQLFPRVTIPVNLDSLGWNH